MAAEQPNHDLHAELFGEDSDDGEYQEEEQEDQQQEPENLDAAPAPEFEGDDEQQAQPYEPAEAGDGAEAGEYADGQQEEYAPEDYEPDQWLGAAAPEDEAQEVGEEDELEAMFKPKKKRKQERELSEKKAAVESILARMEVAAELDIEANQNRKPAIHKLQLLGEVEQMLVQRDLHDELLDGGVLGVFKVWLEPMPDGSLPNAKVRASVLRLLLQLNFFFEDRKEQLKKSGLGHVIMFLSKLPDELPANRRMARDLVEKWSRPIFEQYRNDHNDRLREDEAAEREADELRRLSQRNKRQQPEEEGARPLRPMEKGFRFSAVVPEKAKLNYKRAPASQVAAEAGGPRGKSAGTRSDRIVKKLTDLGKRSQQSGKAAKISVQGRDLIL